jgi:hypothetical protein
MKRVKQKTPKKKVRNKRVIYSLARKKKGKADFHHANGGHAKGGNGFLHEDTTAYHTRFARAEKLMDKPSASSCNHRKTCANFLPPIVRKEITND